MSTPCQEQKSSKIVIRPSSVSSFVNCSWQWYNTFVLGMTTIPGARAAIGTGVHKGAEVLWNGAIKTGKLDKNFTMLNDAAIEAFDEEAKKAPLSYDPGENANTARMEIVKGVRAFVDDIVPYTAIPDAVESRYTVKIEHDIVEAVSGTIDYINIKEGTIGDIKTSKRTPVAANYDIQQSIYKFLAEQNGVKVVRNLIQGVVFTKETKGTILELDTKVPMAKYLVNNMLDSLDALKTGLVDPKVLFRGNPKWYLCDNRYCALHKTCLFANGDAA